jgi:hypothetical protein
MSNDSPRQILKSLAEKSISNETIQDLSTTQLISENNIVKTFVASYNPCYEWPYRLQKIQQADKEISNRACEYILDSGYKDPSVSNEDILEKASEIRPNLIIPKDYPEEQPAKTARSLAEFKEAYDDNPNVRANILAPVQPPYDKTYENHREIYQQFTRFALGGLHCFRDTAGQIQSIKRFNEVLPHDAHIHALGVGMNVEFMYYLRQNPELIDSIDISTPEFAPMKCQMPDKTWIQQRFQIPSGDNRSVLQADLSRYLLRQFNYMLTDWFDDDDWEPMTKKHRTQTNLDKFTKDIPEFSRQNPPREPARAHQHAQPAD